MLLSLSARALWGFGGGGGTPHSWVWIREDRLALCPGHCLAKPRIGKLGKQWWSRRQCHLRMVKQGVLVRRWVWDSLCLAGLSTEGREAQPSTCVWPAWPGYHWAQFPLVSGQQAWTQRGVKTVWGTSSLEGAHGDYSPFGVSPGASSHQAQVPPPVDPTGPGLPEQNNSQVAPLLSQFCDPLMLRRSDCSGIHV